MHGCPFCDSYKVDEHGKKVNTRGKYKEVDDTKIEMRTWKNISVNNDKFVLEGEDNRKNLKNFKSCEAKPLQLKKHKKKYG